MIKTVKKEVEECSYDFCDGPAYRWNQCLACGIHLCSECLKTKAQTYNYAVHFSGGDDGIYCLNCLAMPTVRRSQLFRAYQKVADLRQRSFTFYTQLDEDRKEPEATIERLRKGK